MTPLIITPDQAAAAEAEYLGMRCRVCGCTQADCARCIQETGRACEWLEPGLCSACGALGLEALLDLNLQAHLAFESRSGIRLPARLVLRLINQLVTAESCRDPRVWPAAPGVEVPEDRVEIFELPKDPEAPGREDWAFLGPDGIIHSGFPDAAAARGCAEKLAAGLGLSVAGADAVRPLIVGA